MACLIAFKLRQVWQGYSCLLLTHCQHWILRLPQMNERLLLGNLLTSTLMILRRVQIVSGYRAGTNNASYNKYSCSRGELNGRILKLAINKKPRNSKLPSMQRSDLVLEECVEVVILILQSHYRVSDIIWLYSYRRYGHLYWESNQILVPYLALLIKNNNFWLSRSDDQGDVSAPHI